MQEQFNKKFNKRVMVISPGEYFATRDDIVIGTLLGSCIAACLYDPVNRVIGMNHFLLAGNVSHSDQYFLSESGRYGVNAMELLINEMMKIGAKRNLIKAKAFGGAHVLSGIDADFNGIPATNVRFIKTFLYTENIELVGSDLGGHTGRKVYLFNYSYKVLLKKLDSTKTVQTEKQEEAYWRSQKARMNRFRNITPLEQSKENNIDFF